VDLHVHNRLSKTFDFSEGAIPRLKELGARRGLNGLALTEHIHAKNFWDMHDRLQARYPYQDGWYDMGDGFRMFSGCEVTVRERVDFIVVGELDEIQRLDAAFSPRLSEWHQPPALAFLEAAAYREVIVISAHPYREGKQTAKLPLAEVFSRVDAVEVNGRDHGKEQKTASLAAEWGLPLSGGSDSHYYLQVGIRSTIIPDDELSLESMQRAFDRKSTRVHCKRYAPAVVEFCQQIKRVVKLRTESAAEAVA
jgi:hypothetical protein